MRHLHTVYTTSFTELHGTNCYYWLFSVIFFGVVFKNNRTSKIVKRSRPPDVKTHKSVRPPKRKEFSQILSVDDAVSLHAVIDGFARDPEFTCNLRNIAVMNIEQLDKLPLLPLLFQ